MKFAIVVAADEAGGIGKNGRLPWRLKGDMAYFKQLTTEPPAPGLRNVVIMGRKTWESIPERFRPLPGRINVVISGNAQLMLPKDVFRAGSLDAALARVQAMRGVGRVFVIGGGQIFREAASRPDLETIYLTRIHKTMDCDTFIPPISAPFALVSTSELHVENGLAYDFGVYRLH